MVARRSIYDIVEDIVNSIDKTITIRKIELANNLNTKLFVCSFKWLQVGSVVLDDQDRDATVVEILEDEGAIIVQKSNPFTWTSKVITIVKDIYYFTGTPRQTNSEWLTFSNDETRKTPFVWLVEPTTEVFNTNGQGISRTADLRLYFLDIMKPLETTKKVRDNVINYLSTWVDGFFLAINKNKDFAKFDDFRQREITYFGVENSDGYDRLIIESNLSAIEIRFTLPIKKGAKCLC